MKFKRLNRRYFISAFLLGTPMALLADALWFEPSYFKVAKLRLAEGKPTARFVHFTDLHHKGDRAYLTAVVKKINQLKPDFVCFTGDLIEDAQFLPEALELLRGIDSPLYGVPGNHDYWSKVDFRVIAEAFANTGGKWLMDESTSTLSGKVNIVGATCGKTDLNFSATAKNVVLIHYPQWVEKIAHYKFDIALAGHSHGGQVRIPFYGPLVVPFSVGRYDLGLFQTPAGPLYVGAGLGWFYLNIRFNCRPEITLIEI